jgi:cytochrome c2
MAADAAAQEVAPKVMTAGEAVYTENCAHCHKATDQCDGDAAPTLAGLFSAAPSANHIK